MRLASMSSIAAALGTVLLLASPASAALSAGPFAAKSGIALAPGTIVPSSAVISVTDFDVTGIYSIDPIGDPLNEVFTVFLAPNASVIGIGWNVTLFADSPSWLSEMVVSYGSSSSFYNVFLTPGIGDNFPGTKNYSSGGIVDLIGLGLNFDVDADGLLRLEFFESFDDYFNDWDGIWERGTLSIQWSVRDGGGGGGVIPEPGTWAMMIAGFGLVGLAARRRRTAVTA